MSDEKKEGTKFDNAKPRPSLMPMGPLLEVAALYTMGATKYRDHNWEYGMKWSRIFDALMRHAMKWWGGEELDQEDGQSHLAAVVWNALALMEYRKTHPELDDRLTSPKLIVIDVSKLSDEEAIQLSIDIESAMVATKKKNSQCQT